MVPRSIPDEMDRALDFIVVSICSFIAIKSLAIRLNVPIQYDLIFAVAALWTAALVTSKEVTSRYSGKLLFGAIFGVIFFIYLLFIYLPSGAVLPSYDPIAVPTIAKIISQGRSPLDYYSPGDL